MMKTQTQKTLQQMAITLIGLLAVFMTLNVKADEKPAVFNTQIHIGSDGFAIQQPVISQTEILGSLTLAHRLLSKQSKNAKKIIRENDTSKNMTIAAFMPGGLIYLAYKQSKLSSAKTSLTKINSELAKLDEDAVSLYQPVYQPAHQTIIIARYP